MASPISSGVAGRPAGAWAASCSKPSPIASVPSVRVGPGLTALTRTPLWPYSAAHDLVNRLNRCLARAIETHAGDSVIGNHRRYIDNCPFTSTRHQRSQFGDEEIWRLNVERIHSVKLLFRHFVCRSER